jgi:cytochrome P450
MHKTKREIAGLSPEESSLRASLDLAKQNPLPVHLWKLMEFDFQGAVNETIHWIRGEGTWRSVLTAAMSPQITEGLAGAIAQSDRSGPYLTNLPLFGKTLLITDPSMAVAILREFEDGGRTALTLSVVHERLLGEATIGLEGEKWRQYSNSNRPAFAGNKIDKAYTPIFDSISKSYIDAAADKLGEEGVISSAELGTMMTASILVNALFSVDFPPEELAQMAQLTGNVLKLMNMLVIPPVPKDGISALPQFEGIAAQFDQLRAKTFRFVADRIDQVLAGNIAQLPDDMLTDLIGPEGAAVILEADPSPLATELLAEISASLRIGDLITAESCLQRLKDSRVAADPETAQLNGPLTLKAISDQVLMFMFAGHETTATLFQWAMLRLSQNPELQKDLLAEIQSITTYDAEGRPQIDMSKISTLRLLDAFIWELLRFDPPVSSIFREFADNGEGYTAFFFIKKINRDPAVFGKDADDFNPYRFIDMPDRRRATLTFSNGPFRCIGQAFALREAKVMLVRLILGMDILPRTDIPLNPPMRTSVSDKPIKEHTLFKARPRRAREA